MKSIHTIIVSVIGLLLLSITEFGIFKRMGKGIIRDSVVGSKYQVVSVDGEQPERMQHGLIITVVPLVLVKSGERLIELKKENRSLSPKKKIETYRVKAKIESGEHYEIIEVEGNPQIFIAK